jgi:predicted MFS family arabinose efflux permease
LTFALGFMPHVFGGTLLSSVADRYPVRRTLICCDLASAGLVALMALPGLPIPLLLGLLLPLGAIAPVFGGARAASLPDVLGGEGFALGRSLLRMVAQTSQIGGFALGGVLLAMLSPRPLLLLDAASFVASAVLLRVGTRERSPRADLPAAAAEVPRRSVARDSLAGVRLALGSARLRPLLLFYWLPPIFTVAPEALATPYVAQLGGSPAAVGLLLAAAAAGSVAGMLAAGAWLSPSRRLRLMVPLASWTFLPLLGFGARPGLIPAMALLVLSGLGLQHRPGPAPAGGDPRAPARPQPDPGHLRPDAGQRPRLRRRRRRRGVRQPPGRDRRQQPRRSPGGHAACPPHHRQPPTRGAPYLVSQTQKERTDVLAG